AEKFSAVFVSIDDNIQFSSCRIDHQAMDRNIRIQQWMVANHVDTVGDAFFDIIEAAEPAFQINSRILHHLDGFLIHASFFNLLEHFMWFNIRHAAIVMPDNIDFVCIQFIYGYQQTAHNAAEWVIDDSTGTFDDFNVTIFKVHRFWQHFKKTRVHACQNNDFLVRKLGGHVLFVTLFFHKLFVVLQNFI